MANRYRLILSNNNFYREVQLPSAAGQYCIGTTYESDCRFAKERFFTDFELLFVQRDGNWTVSCRRGDIYFLDKGTMKLKSYRLSHGSELQVLYQYQGNDQILFKLSFILDFEAEKANYERVLDIGGMNVVSFGRDRNCDVILDDPLIGADIVRLERRGSELVLVDYGSRYGVYVNGVKVQGETQIQDYDFFSILGFSFYHKGGELYTSRYTKLYPGSIPVREIADQYNHLNYPQFNRNTQVKVKIPEDDISVLDPPAKPEKPKKNIVMTLLPSLAMIALVVVMRGLMSGGGNMSFVLYSAATMSLGVITTVVGFITSGKEYKENTAKREKEYKTYIHHKRGEIRAARDQEKELLEQTYISPEWEEANVNSFAGALFDRTPEDKDFLTLRLGTGSREAARKIAFKPKEQITVSDPMAEYPQKLYTEFKLLDNVPIVLPLASANAVGVEGNDAALYEFAKQTVLDICTRQYYDDVRLFLISERELEPFAWARWLPHFDNEALDIRNIASSSEERTALLEYLYSELLRRSQQKKKLPHLVVLVFCCPGFKNHPVSKFIGKAASLGVSFLFFENYRELLPQYCSRIVSLLDQPGEGNLILADGSAPETRFTYRSLPDPNAEKIAMKLAPVYCEEISLEGTLTKNISFFEMLGIFTVDDLDLNKNWSNAQIYKTMAAPVGVKTQNELVYLDLHEKAHGPHGLVAGTTGSGKSEALQTYILSMAIHYHPYEVGFVIIDFKGGGMANQFENLPHLVGTITNIDGREIDRSLKSIKAELQKRQRVFAEAGVNNIGNYIKKYKAGEVSLPLPHLIIVVDEFAELKAEQPEFMKELISAARIGRSLGVHLILATQKPAGQVNEQIWSNSRFKLCLKVQTPEDSNEVLKSPLAAEIKEPGRAYLQVGNNELFELFQSAYSGAPAAVTDFGAKKSFRISRVSLGGKRQVVFQQKPEKRKTSSSVSQLEAVVDYVGAYCGKSNIQRLPAICLPSLADLIRYPDAVPPKDEDYTVSLGVYDDPDNQYQGLATMKMADSNLLIIGSAQTGKTNLLQVIIRQMAETYSPRELAIYIADFGAMSLRNFEKLSHVGGVVTATEDERFKNLFKLLSEEIALRKQKLADSGLSSFAAYMEAGNTDLPLILFIMDNFSVFKELYADEYEGTLLYLVREGVTYGITVVMTNPQTSGLNFRYLSNIGNRVAFTCNDRGEYSSVLDRCRMEPKNVPGRALFAKDKMIYEFQSYLSFEGEKEIDRVNQIRSFTEAVNAKYEGMRAKQIPSIPEVVSISYIRQNYPRVNPAENITIALDYGTIECVSLNCSEQLILAVAGKNAAGRQNFLRTLMADIRANVFRRPVQLYILDNFKRELEEYKELPYVENYTTSADNITQIIDEVHDELEERYSTLEDEGIEALNDMPWIIVFVNNKTALDVIVGSRAHETAFTEICKKFSNLKILFLLTDVNDAPISSTMTQMLRRVKEDKKLLYFGSLKEMKIIDLYGSAARGLSALASADDAYYLNGETIQRVKTIQEV